MAEYNSRLVLMKRIEEHKIVKAAMRNVDLTPVSINTSPGSPRSGTLGKQRSLIIDRKYELFES